MSQNLITPLTIKKFINFLAEVEKSSSKSFHINSQAIDKIRAKTLEEHWQKYVGLPFKISSIDEIEAELEVIMNEAKNLYLGLDLKIKKRLIRYIKVTMNS